MYLLTELKQYFKVCKNVRVLHNMISIIRLNFIILYNFKGK